MGVRVSHPCTLKWCFFFFFFLFVVAGDHLHWTMELLSCEDVQPVGVW